MPTPVTWKDWCFMGSVLLMVMLIVFFVVRRLKRRSLAPSADLIAKAYRETLAALAICPTTDRTQTATECSMLLRRYLSQITGDPALYQTHEEWVSRHDSLNSFSDALKEQTHTLFTNLAQSKYAPADHGDDPATIIEHSRQLLEAINREVRP